MNMPWMDWMKQHIGQPEVTGTRPSAFVEECFSHTNFGPLHGQTPASCAATACAALEESGYKSTKSAAAVSFAKYGSACPLQPGCIVVFQWANGEHHVTFCQSLVGSNLVTCLGGNQGHKVQPSTFGRQWIIATRWPVQ